ncbi:MAG: glycosyltransferase family 2 protein [Bacteroidales bacterium]|nr:glycosyltransferase family 2 protein [Bacteroidales bacterium]
MNFCTLIPTYNNGKTLGNIIERTLTVCNDIVVVNDGSTDNTAEILGTFSANKNITVVSYPNNKGKGYALRLGLQKARELGFDYSVTVDSDGQHFPEDIPLLLEAAKNANGSRILVVGSRNLKAEGMPERNTFANNFSNFWFKVQTFKKLPDTQTGFRLYSLHNLPNLKILTRRYETELELLVFSAWRNVKLIPTQVRVYYPPKEERVSHFRPFADFTRISILNTFLCFAALLYGYPSMLIRSLIRK